MPRSNLLLLAAPLALLLAIIIAWPSPKLPSQAEHRDAIFWAAENLVTRQNPDGGWSYDGTGKTTRGSRASIGRALLYAHNVTGSPVHLAAAIFAADSLVVTLNAEPETALAMDGIFLEEAARVTGVAEYGETARRVHQIRRVRNGWTTGEHAASAYLEAAEQVKGDELLRRNVAIWRGLDEVQLAVLIGETAFASEMARDLLRGAQLDPSLPAGTLAAGRAVEVLGELPGDDFQPRIEGWLGRLVQSQTLPGVVGEEQRSQFVYAQDASHALRAFTCSRDGHLWQLARSGSGFFVNEQLSGTDGSWASVLYVTPGAEERVSASPGVTADVLLALARTERKVLRPYSL